MSALIGIGVALAIANFFLPIIIGFFALARTDRPPGLSWGVVLTRSSMPISIVGLLLLTGVMWPSGPLFSDDWLSVWIWVLVFFSVANALALCSLLEERAERKKGSAAQG